MKNKILFASSEVVPFAKVGGLGDVVGALSKALIHKKQEVKIIIPKHNSVKKYMEEHSIKPVNTYYVNFAFNDMEYNFTLEEVHYQENTYLFVDIPELFDRDNPYVGIVTGREYNDNLLRYVVFDRAVLESCKAMSWIPDILHCHDWQMGLIPLFKRALVEYNTVFFNTKTVFTIHNLAYQGIFPVDQYPVLGIDWKYFHINGIEYYRHINLLKCGIVFSDAVNTVSKNYAKEIKIDGSGLEGVLQEKDLMLTCSDFSRFSESFDDIMDCR